MAGKGMILTGEQDLVVMIAGGGVGAATAHAEAAGLAAVKAVAGADSAAIEETAGIAVLAGAVPGAAGEGWRFVAIIVDAELFIDFQADWFFDPGEE